jgi:hypothetical protein
MHDDIVIATAARVDSELVDAMQRLVSQLSASAPAPGHDELRDIVDSACTTLLVARDRSRANRIIGSLTLACSGFQPGCGPGSKM